MSEPLYKYLGFWWKSSVDEPPSAVYVDGPYCLTCHTDLYIPIEEDEIHEYRILEQTWTGEVACELCGRKYKVDIPIFDLKHRVALKLKSDYRSRLTKISLEEPITEVKVRDQDDKYFLSAKIGQKDGKRVGVVYFGEKAKDQRKEDYSQIFIDLDDEQIRFDKSNKHPKAILAKFKVEFAGTVSSSEFGKRRH